MALEPVAPVSAAGKVEYTCPMHPEIIRSEPGSCPICGMALEPREVTGEEVNPELADMSRRFRASAALTLPILAFMISEMIPSHPLKEWLGSDALLWLQFALASPVMLWGGWPFFHRGWLSVKHRSLNMFTLIALGTGAAYLYSVFALLFPGTIPASFRNMAGELAVYLRAGGGDRNLSAAWPGARAACAQPDLQCDQIPAWLRAQDGAGYWDWRKRTRRAA